MKKATLAAAVALAIGGSAVGTAEANSAGLTGVWDGTYVFNMYSPGGVFVGSSGAPQQWNWDFDAGTVSIVNTTSFYGSVWTAHDVTVDNGQLLNYPNTMLFDWSVNANIPVVGTWDIDLFAGPNFQDAHVTVFTSTITPNSPAFPGFHPQFSGNIHQSAQPPEVPVPAAAWLMGSGLLGLVGVARRRRNK